MNVGYKSDIGKVRTVNQDAYLVLDDIDPHVQIFAVADGLGGHNAGEVASNMLVDGLKEILYMEEIINKKSVNNELMIEKIKKINSEIFQAGSKNTHLNKMGTTLSLTIIIGETIYIFHVGDSRIYMVNPKKMVQLTKDHSLVEQLVAQGEISKEEANTHPNKNILTRAIGTDDDIDIDFYKYTIKSAEKILLCTDGLTNLLGVEEIKDIVNDNTCKDAVDILIDKANENGGSDNITVIVYKPEVFL